MSNTVLDRSCLVLYWRKLSNTCSAIEMIACGIGVLKGQQDSSPGQSEATPWVCGIIMNFSLFLFRAGEAAGAKQEKGKWGWMGRFPGRRSLRPLPWATVLLPLRGAMAESAAPGNLFENRCTD